MRFAITGEEADKHNILAIADEMDRLGYWPSRSPFGFFLRTSEDLCRALTKINDPDSLVILRRYIDRIEDRRVRRAMAEAVGIEGLLDPLSPRERPLRAGMAKALAGHASTARWRLKANEPRK
jgi:hypothetical protein